MSEISNINLLTKDEKKHLGLVSLLFKINIASIVILLITIGLCIFFYRKTDEIKNNQASLEQELESLRVKSTEYSEEEILNTQLNNYYTSISNFYTNYTDYSKLLENIFLRRQLVPGVKITNLTFDPVNYLVVLRVKSSVFDFKEFVKNMKDQEIDMDGLVIKGLFSSSEIPEQVNNATGEYILTLKFESELLQ